ncbi:phosphatidylcholine:ceramide cholinephosphotransferase 2 [Pygocentrus nattereri]|uniref:Sphingomyelin synthase-like domain-containing protein n=1 Tax=Pygocentrus nattereri TaxID=42514 RepID=A0A3B4E7N2_PYGNA|nr:phosphatidylcholine:ceramide cholinephosphotransferase 2 [Pygocentrus nattereri]XP_017539616.1 phosphatidylcholine:ceramide cholinephosphotransferase 2 [Pygocentrus nattereri]
MAVSQLPDSGEHSNNSSYQHVEVTVTDSPHMQTTSSRLTHPSQDMQDNGQQGNGRSSRLSRGFAKVLRKNQDYIRIRVPESRLDQLPPEWWKTGLSFMWAGFNLFCTTVMITVVNDRVPDKSVNPPLPDKFFDYVPRVEWAFTITEVNGMILVMAWFVQWLLLKHKSIIGRRFFFLMGTLYLYRIITMYITTLPVPSMHMNCAPKLYDDPIGKVHRVLQLLSGGGLSITGSHMMCGDFLYSGHTVMLTLTFLFIREYSPRSLWWYHLICWFLSAVGVVCILLAHEHYSVDVIVAYFITTRLFWWYHTLANNQSLRDSPHNYFNRVWWRFFFRFMERNVTTTVPCTFSWPLPLPATCSKNPCRRYSIVQSVREEADGEKNRFLLCERSDYGCSQISDSAVEAEVCFI